MTKTFFALADVDSLKPEVDPAGNLDIRYKPEETPITTAAKSTFLGRVYLDWAKFPITETEVLAEGGYVVRFEDLRFEQAGMHSVRKPLACGIMLDRGLKVVNEFFGANPQPPD